MKKLITVSILILLTIAVPVLAGDFLGVPIRSGGQTLQAKKSFMEVRYDLPQEEITQFYRDAMKGQSDLKFRDRGDGLEIEDHGRRAWHKILIAIKENGQIAVTITQDSWTWIMGTLSIRFIGVFMVLLVLYLAMSTSTGIISRSIKAVEARGGGKA
ncbi:MAG: hypothetical protein H8E10_05210 [Desulfobacterales bacterium]|nr:hypothetical protein [Desulfobacterales bacterium]MBL7101232.1 hypothetical protein [Desulfobacteraceae bacterium]MBL7172291.1 hypothetical protein [Desulfobacteraceae bacterium]